MRWLYLLVGFLVALIWVNAAGDFAGKVAVIALTIVWLLRWSASAPSKDWP